MAKTQTPKPGPAKCIFPDCTDIVANGRLDRHLRKRHGLTPGTLDYRLAKSVMPLRAALQVREEARPTAAVVRADLVDVETEGDEAGGAPCRVDLSARREEFGHWLSTLDGGQKSPAVTRQTVSQTYGILVGGDRNRLPCARTFFPCEHAVLDVRTLHSAVQRLLKRDDGSERRPGTMVSYLCSLKAFFKYLELYGGADFADRGP